MHKGTSYPGLHPAIIDQQLFDAVQAVLARKQRGKRERSPSPAPLAGLLYDALGNRMAATHAQGRGGKRYLYYISPVPASHPDSARVLRRIPAPGIENILMERLRYWSSRPNAGWSDLLPFVTRVELHCEAMVVDLLPPPHEKWFVETTEQSTEGPDDAFRITSPVRIQTRGGRTSRIEGSASPLRSRPDKTLIAGLRRAHAELKKCGIDVTDIKASIEHARGIKDPYLRKLSGLAFLAPDIQRAILEGRQPADLKLADLISLDLPFAWEDQRNLLGMT